MKMANTESLVVLDEFDQSAQGVNFMSGTTEFFIPIEINQEEEKKKIVAEIERYTNFLTSVKKKLSNQKFVESAPPKVVELERKKESDATEKLKNLNEQLQRFK